MATKDLPITKIEDTLTISPHIKKKQYFFQGYDTTDTIFEFNHHEGLMQTKQPLFFGPGYKNEKLVYSSAKKLLNIGFLKELKLNQIQLVSKASNDAVNIFVHVQKLVINTYGNGLFGVGSAGNYWECFLYIDKIFINNKQFNSKVYQLYAKLNESPIKMDSVFDTIMYVAQVSLNPEKILNWDGTDLYKLDQKHIEKQSVIELSSRLLAREFLKDIQNKNF